MVHIFTAIHESRSTYATMSPPPGPGREGLSDKLPFAAKAQFGLRSPPAEEAKPVSVPVQLALFISFPNRHLSFHMCLSTHVGRVEVVQDIRLPRRSRVSCALNH